MSTDSRILGPCTTLKWGVLTAIPVGISGKEQAQAASPLTLWQPHPRTEPGAKRLTEAQPEVTIDLLSSGSLSEIQGVVKPE